MDLSQAIGNLVEACRRDVPDCIAAGVVDLSTGRMLHSDTADGHPSEVLEVLAAATVDLFQGRATRRVEGVWRQRRGVVDEGHYFEEILVHSTNLVHLFVRSRSRADLAVGIVCAKGVKVGILFAQARAIVRDFDDAAA
jgi:hypothetical protein